MSDRTIIDEIVNIIGNTFVYKFENKKCVYLSFSKDTNIFNGSLRHLSFDLKQTILKLVCKLENLVNLDLSRNLLHNIPEDLLHLQFLQSLNLLSNNLKIIPNFISKFKHLKYLNIGSNDLCEIPKCINDIPTLEHLLLLKNVKIKNIDNISNLVNLKTLNLYFINLIKLPTFVYGFKQLNTLTLWNTSKFPESLEAFQNLEYFTNCGTPSLVEVPYGLCDVPNLKMVRLYQNSLKTLTEDIGKLTMLQQLSLYQNKLESLPESIYNLKSLVKLNLGWNNIKNVHLKLFDSPALQWVGMFQNPCSEYIETLKQSKAITKKPFTTNFKL